MSRPAAREAAMQLVFEQLFGGEGEPGTLVELTGYEPSENDAEYIARVVSGVREKREALDQEISACLRGWTLERIARVNHAILLLAAFEMKDGLPAGIAINEALELTRKFSGEESVGFINGVLGTIRRRMGNMDESDTGV